ncbi:MAG: hypothetical protein M1495_18065 [Bacteroidetes bacterium]|nr:hypothetical protein [Bacteroidota bacterium]
MRRKRQTGLRYNFLIELSTLEKYYINIWAKYRLTKQVSPISNLNAIISEIKSENDNRQLYFESTWIFNDKPEAGKIYKKLIELFQTKIFLKYLEDKLDEDRLIGGWNSGYSF